MSISHERTAGFDALFHDSLRQQWSREQTPRFAWDQMSAFALFAAKSRQAAYEPIADTRQPSGLDGFTLEKFGHCKDSASDECQI